MIDEKKLIKDIRAYADLKHYNGEVELANGILKSLSVINNQPQVNQWIPCSERLPTSEEYQRNDCRFIVTDGNRVYEDLFDYMADGYIEPKWMQSTCQVIAWQSLPSPCREESNE